MKPIEELRESEQQALLASVGSDARPGPVLFVGQELPLPTWASVSAAVAGALLAWWLVAEQFGQPGLPGALQGLSWWPIYFVACGWMLGAVLPALHLRWLNGRVGVPAGVYLFATAVVQVRGGRIHAHRFVSPPLLSTTHRHGRVVVRVWDDQQAFTLNVPRTMESMRQVAFAASALRATGMSMRAADVEWLGEQDPLVRRRRDVQRPVPRPVAAHLGKVWPSVVVASMVFSAVVQGLRNDASDRALVASIRSDDDVAHLRWYASSTGDHAEEAATRWLPELASQRFERGVQLQSSAYWKRFLDDFHDFDDLVRSVRSAHLPDALLAEALADGSVDALRAFVAAHPGPGHEQRRATADSAIGARYLAAAVAFDQQATRGRRLRQVMTATFDWLKDNDTSSVQVLFRPSEPSGIDAADAYLEREQARFACSRFTPATPFLAQDRWRYAERRILQLLQRGFASIAPEDVLALEATEVSELDPTRPRIEVAYRVAPLGGQRSPTVFVERTTQECVLGLTVRFDIQIAPPGGGRAHSVRVDADPPDEFEVAHAGRFVSGSTDNSYDRMLGLAFANLATALRTELFASDSQASTDMEAAMRAWDAGVAASPSPSP